MSKPQIRFKGFEDEWEIAPFKSLCTYTASNLTATDAMQSGKYPLFDANKFIGFTDLAHINKSYISIIKDGAGVGRVRALPKDSFIIGTLGALVPNDNSLITFLLPLTSIQNFASHNSGSTIPHIYFSQYGESLVAFPNTTEQGNIGDFFKQIDEMITEVEREVSRLEKMKQASLQKMFPRPGAIAPEIRVGGFTEPWFSFRLCDISSYRSSSLKVSDAQQNGKYVLYDANNPIGYIDSEPIRSEYVSIIKDGAGVGRCRLLPKNTFIIGTLGAIIPKENCHIDFLYNIISNLRLGEKISGSTIPHIYFSEYGLTQILAPSFSEQIAIGKYFRNLDSLLSAKRQKLVKLRNIKQACLDKMFVNTSDL